MIATILLEDINNKPGKHIVKNQTWEENGIEVIRQRLPVGDYVMMNEKIYDVFERKTKRGIPIKMMDLLGTYEIAVDSKKDIQELCGDICGPQHERFRDECILAQNNGIKLIVLVENEDDVSDLTELHKWANPRLFIRRGGKQLYPKATRGVTLMKACMSMEKKYDVKFVFVSPINSAEAIVKLLEGGDKNG